MNTKRIRELNMQAAEYATSVCPNHSRDWYPIQNTKFAELIIRECANELLKWRQEPFPLDADSAVRIIKQHFGIEE